MVELVRRGNVEEATDALLELTYDEPDRRWLQDFILECLDPGVDEQVRALAVTCAGHVARLDGEVGPALLGRLHELADDPALAGIVEDALADIDSFANRPGNGVLENFGNEELEAQWRQVGE
ncbi:hypothetical protein [Amycolatopsis sp. lyj-23]|uniref:hypothetical protein n=1 Tax=Amycolatopsis sp. lyj-23 TaxID=2789283 RepID=UPI0039799864